MNLSNKIFLVINTIALLFFIFSDEMIMRIKWSSDGISVGDIATIISAIVMMITAYFMYQANKTSAQSVEEMKKQREFEYNKLERDELRCVINENIMPYIKQFRQSKMKRSDHIDIQILEKVSMEIYLSLMQLGSFSKNAYHHNIIKITHSIFRLIVFILHPEVYSYNAKLYVCSLLAKLGENLYSLILDEKLTDEWIKLIKKESEELYRVLTTDEKIKAEQHLKEYIQDTEILKQYRNQPKEN